LQCNSCHTKVSGSYPLPVLTSLNKEEQEFLLLFIKNSGSLKLMAEQTRLSYPTVRNRLDELIERINSIENELKKHPSTDN
jgi:hypothetical protein